MSSSHRVIAIVGPTAIGKSAFAVELAECLGTGIISADSRQVYRYMDIGTAKPSATERARVRHSMIDVVEPSDTYSAQRFRAEALRILLQDALSQRTSVVCGGTGFYLRALLDGLSMPHVPPDSGFRERMRLEAEEFGVHELHLRLAQVDPASAARVHPNNLPRLIRALEIVKHLGGPVPRVPAESGIPAVYFGLTCPRTELDAHIDDRVHAQMRSGLLDETRQLLAMGYEPSLPALQGFGYRHLIDYLEGRCNLEDAVRDYQVATRQYARRQMTWFRADKRIQWLSPDAPLLEQAMARLSSIKATGQDIINAGSDSADSSVY